MNIPSRISKEEINSLPLYRFSGKVKLIESEADQLEAVNDLKNEKVLGFDTETRAAFRKGESYDISLLQLATNTKAYLFRINKSPMIPELVELLSDENIIKAGVAVRDDVKGLQKLYPFTANSFVDLGQIAKEKKIITFGLRPLTAIYLKKRLTKGAKISNWAQDELTPDQIRYAACDAVVGYELYFKLCE